MLRRKIECDLLECFELLEFGVAQRSKGLPHRLGGLPFIGPAGSHGRELYLTLRGEGAGLGHAKSLSGRNEQRADRFAVGPLSKRCRLFVGGAISSPTTVPVEPMSKTFCGGCRSLSAAC